METYLDQPIKKKKKNENLFGSIKIEWKHVCIYSKGSAHWIGCI